MHATEADAAVLHCRSERLNLDRWEGTIIVVSLTATSDESEGNRSTCVLFQLPDWKECKIKASLWVGAMRRQGVVREVRPI